MSGDGPAKVRFSDGKDPEAMRTIGEVGEALGVKTHILRYWEDQFPTLRPLKRSGGRRLYRPEDVALVAWIDRLVNREGYTLKGARAVIAGAAETVPAKPAEEAAAIPEEGGVVNRLREIRTRLSAALDA